MRVLFAGTPEAAVPSLDGLLASGHEVVGVLTRPAAPAGRGRKLVASPVAVRAEKAGLPVLTPAHPRDPEFAAALADLSPDACAVVAYGALLPGSVLAAPRHGWVNLHFSVLPRWRGAAPVQRGIIAGDDEVGATTFRIVRELDAGPVFRTLRLPLDPLATAGDVLADLSVRGAELLVETLTGIEAGEQPTPQDDAGLTLAPKLTVDAARIDWTTPTRVVHDHVRGNSPDPGAWTLHAGHRLKVLRSAPAAAALPPGELAVCKRQVLVGTGDGALELVEVQPFGKRAMRGADWGRGGVASGEVLA